MKKILIILAGGIFFSCKNIQQQEITKEPEPQLSKLEQLKRHRSDIPLDYVDLSNENLTEMPYLGDYTIKSLNLSHNQIEKLVFPFLPKELERLDISYNSLKIVLMASNMKYPTDEINLSHNQINFIQIGFPIRKLIASYNDIKELHIEVDKMEFLDVSHNSNFDNVVWFNPEKIDTILYDFTLKNKPLIIKPIPSPHIIK